LSRVYDALRKLEEQGRESAAKDPVPPALREPLRETAKTMVVPSNGADQLLSAPSIQAHMGAESRIVVYSNPRSPWAERFRLIRMALRNNAGGKLPKVLLVTSPLPRDGKSTVALNLATSLAENGKVKVALVECDLHRPTLSSNLGLERMTGLSEVLHAQAELPEAVRRVEPLSFYLLPSGRPPDNPAELLQSERFHNVLRDLKNAFDCVLIDCPPAFPLADVVVLKAHADGVLLVARAGTTPREAVEETMQVFKPGHVVGMVLNAADAVNQLYQSYYYRKDPSLPSGQGSARGNGSKG
jgi:capsular exopolysaccharide synthesis family protein